MVLLSLNMLNTQLINSLSSFLVLVWAQIVLGYAIWMLMVYLTDVWKLTITHAAGIINAQRGLICALPIVMQTIVDTLAGNYWMLTFSSFACCTVQFPLLHFFFFFHSIWSCSMKNPISLIFVLFLVMMQHKTCDFPHDLSVG